MANQAMRAARGDVRGREIKPTSRRRGQSSRDISGRRAVFTQRHGRLLYRGGTRTRDTQVMPGHPLAGLWTSWQSARRSHRPEVRRWAGRQMVARNALRWDDEMAGVEL